MASNWHCLVGSLLHHINGGWKSFESGFLTSIFAYNCSGGSVVFSVSCIRQTEDDLLDKVIISNMSRLPWRTILLFKGSRSRNNLYQMGQLYQNKLLINEIYFFDKLNSSGRCSGRHLQVLHKQLPKNSYPISPG